MSAGVSVARSVGGGGDVGEHVTRRNAHVCRLDGARKHRNHFLLACDLPDIARAAAKRKERATECSQLIQEFDI